MKKKNMLGVCIACCALSFAGALSVMKTSSYGASADADGLKMIAGASVRLRTENDAEDVAVNGIRFAAQMTKAKYESLTGKEVVLQSTAKANGVTKTANWILKSENSQNVAKITFKDDIVTFYHTITFDSLFGAENAEKLRQANAWDFTVNYSLNSDNDAEDWTSETVTRSMRQVAYTSYTTPSTDEEPNAGYNNATLLNYFTPSNEKKVYYSNGVEDVTKVGDVTGMKAYAYDTNDTFVDVSAETANSLYGDGATLGAKTDVIAFDENNVAYNTTVQSATMLYTAEDLKALVDLPTGTNSAVTKTGYYALANDITVDAWTGSGDSGYYMTFAGVFDGNGHTLTVPMRAYSLFGKLTGQIKNTYIEFTHVRHINGYGSNNLLTESCLAQYKPNGVLSNSLENLYITIDKGTFKTNVNDTPATTAFNNFSLLGNVNLAIKMQNIVVDYTDIEFGVNDGQYYGYGLLMQKDNAALGEVWNPMLNVADIYFISSDLKLISNHTYNKYQSSHKVITLYATNDETNKAKDLTAWREADSVDEKLTDITVDYKQYVAKDMYRYDTWTAFDNVADKDFSSFPAEYWTVQNNTIRWKGNAFDYDESLVKTSINGQETSEGVLISDENSAKNKATVSVSYGETQAKIISLTATVGADLVTVDGAVVSAVAGKTGNATISVVYQLPNDNVMRTTSVAFEVSAYEISNEVLLWSSNRDTMYQSENFGTITKIINLADDSVLYDGANYTTATLDNATNVPTAFDVLVERQNASKVKMTLKSYSDYFSTAEEIANVFNVTVATTVNGCYVLAKDVTVAQALKSGEKLTFAGVFDGNGYKLTVPMRDFGLFGAVTGQVKNTWFEFTNVRNIDNYGRNNLLAVSCASQFKVNNVVCNTLENLYITIDKETFNKNLDKTVSATAFTNFSLIRNVNTAVKMQNIIVDYADLIPTEYTKNHGLLVQYYTNPSDTEAWMSMQNFSDVYFISSGLKYISNYVEKKYTANTNSVKTLYATNDEANKAKDLTAWREADSVDEKLTDITVTYNQYVAKNIYRYENWENLNQAGHTFASFASEYWTIKNNTICWYKDVK